MTLDTPVRRFALLTCPGGNSRTIPKRKPGNESAQMAVPERQASPK